MFIIIELYFGIYQDIYMSSSYDEALQLISDNKIDEYSLYQVINDHPILIRTVNDGGYVVNIMEVK